MKLSPKKVNNSVKSWRRFANFMSDQLRKVGKQSVLLELMDEIKQLKNLVKEKEKIITEQTADDLEQYTRMEDVIISGLDTKHRIYASAKIGDRDGKNPFEREATNPETASH